MFLSVVGNCGPLTGEGDEAPAPKRFRVADLTTAVPSESVAVGAGPGSVSSHPLAITAAITAATTDADIGASSGAGGEGGSDSDDSSYDSVFGSCSEGEDEVVGVGSAFSAEAAGVTGSSAVSVGAGVGTAVLCGGGGSACGPTALGARAAEIRRPSPNVAPTSRRRPPPVLSAFQQAMLRLDQEAKSASQASASRLKYALLPPTDGSCASCHPQARILCQPE